jgi:hypothetical protein
MKVSRTLFLRSMAAVFLGWVIVSAFVGILSLYGLTPEPATEQVARNLPFPENEQMLDRIAAELENQAAALAKTEPAAGE